MAKKRPKGWLINPAQVDKWLDQAAEQLIEQDYQGAAQTARRILRYVPKGSDAYTDAHLHLGNALGMLEAFEAAYEAFSQTLAARPDDAIALYDRALTARTLLHTGRAVRDLERAVALEDNPDLRQRYQDELDFTCEVVQEQIAERGPDFTLEQLIQQQDTFREELALMQANAWEEAEVAFRQVIDMGDVLPQPWANIAGCMIMQGRYDEAEDALRRALEIDPEYDLARQNLIMLPVIRERGVEEWRIRSPHAGHEVKRGITFVQED